MWKSGSTAGGYTHGVGMMGNGAGMRGGGGGGREEGKVRLSGVGRGEVGDHMSAMVVV